MITTMPRQGMMMGPMKGHLAPNSSPFKITTNKLSSQYMVQDHMSNHYMKLGTAKAAIDNKPPRSMATSVKKRDQMRREAMAKQMKLLDFEKEMKHGSATPHRHTPDSSVYGSQHRLFSVTVSKTGNDEARPQSVSSFRSGRMSPRPRSALSPRSTKSDLNSPRDKAKKPDVLTQTYSGDYLDRHEERFKNVDTPFAPRLKKRSGKSYLSQSKHYAPPLVLHKESKRKTSRSVKKNKDDLSPTSSASDFEPNETATSREMEQLFSGTKETEQTTDLPRRYSLENSRLTYDNIYSEKRSNDAYGFRHDSLNDTFFGRSSLGRSFARTDTFSNETKNRIQAEEEEMKYLEFINSVTNDILTRGIYSDRVLTQVMQRHLDRNRGRLNEGRMRHMLLKLQEDLGISSEITQRGFATTPQHFSSYDDSSGAESGHHGKKKDSDGEGSVRSTLRFGKTKATKMEKKLGGAVSESSEGRDHPSVKKGILKTPTSSGSELDMKSAALSSADEDDKEKSRKLLIKNDNGANPKEDEDQNKVIELVDGLSLDQQGIPLDEKSKHIISSPKPAKRTRTSSEKAESIAYSLDSDRLVDVDTEVKHDLKAEEAGANSDLDDF